MRSLVQIQVGPRVITQHPLGPQPEADTDDGQQRERWHRHPAARYRVGDLPGGAASRAHVLRRSGSAYRLLPGRVCGAPPVGRRRDLRRPGRSLSVLPRGGQLAAWAGDRDGSGRAIGRDCGLAGVHAPVGGRHDGARSHRLPVEPARGRMDSRPGRGGGSRRRPGGVEALASARSGPVPELDGCRRRGRPDRFPVLEPDYNRAGYRGGGLGRMALPP